MPLSLVERLRATLETTGVVPFVVMQEAISEIERLNAHIEKVEAWQREGDALMGGKTIGTMFSLGAWWADRPWRVREG